MLRRVVISFLAPLSFFCAVREASISLFNFARQDYKRKFGGLIHCSRAREVRTGRATNRAVHAKPLFALIADESCSARPRSRIGHRST